MDSPGFSANFCTYTFMDANTMSILDMEILDKREVQLKSTNMEKEGFIRGIEELQNVTNVEEVVTDAHSQISKLMRENYPHLKHTYDIWHGAKNLAKKISMASKKKDCQVLSIWVKPIINHFWFVMQHSNSYIEFKAQWKSVLHYVTGTHVWLVGDGGTGHCNHDENHEDSDKEAINPNSEAHKTLRKILWDDRFLKKIPYFLNFRSTAVIENVNELILMYASKRHGYQFPVYRSRCFLAAIDYSHHKDTPLLHNRDGEPRLKRKYNKNSARWTAFQEKVPKDYNYIPSMMNDVVMLHETTQTLKKPLGLKPDDPRLISPTIAPLLPQDTKNIAKSMKSRIS